MQRMSKFTKHENNGTKSVIGVRTRRRRNPYFSSPLLVGLLSIWCIIQFVEVVNLRLHYNLGIFRHRSRGNNNHNNNNIRGGGFIINKNDNSNNYHAQQQQQNNINSEDDDETTWCPALPQRLMTNTTTNNNVTKSSTTTTSTSTRLLSPLPIMMTKDELDQQLSIMTTIRSGRTGVSILQCPPKSLLLFCCSCRGIVKRYPNRFYYNHIKHCWKILKDSPGFVTVGVPILYFDDDTLTIVEEDKGRFTMKNGKIPVDFDIQLRRLICILNQNYNIIHRDILEGNFIVDQQTGAISVIDFGNAVIWHHGGFWNLENYGLRNLFNILSMWWQSHDEMGQLEKLIQSTQQKLKENPKKVWRGAPSMPVPVKEHNRTISIPNIPLLLNSLVT